MKKYVIVFFTFVFFSWGCSVRMEAKGGDGEKVTLASWNGETFFDGELDGDEYPDFKDYSKWSRDKYQVRLGRLCQVMTTLNPDLMVLEEIENEGVVQDIANHLAGKAWSKKNNWSYATFAKNEGASIGCAVFSRFPIKRVKTHSLDIQTQNEEQPETRPILQVSVAVGGKELEVFANHWKSKSGGQEETELWRDWQELVCARELRKAYVEEGKPCVLCGDFNRDAADFICDFSSFGLGGNTLFRGAEGTQKVFSPWFTSSGSYAGETGSYFYKGEWERIDHIFTTENIKASGFTAKTEGDWADAKGVPKGYKIFTGEGYSDHLPVMCVLVF